VYRYKKVILKPVIKKKKVMIFTIVKHDNIVYD